jgi:hypothetical protein
LHALGKQSNDLSTNGVGFRELSSRLRTVTNLSRVDDGDFELPAAECLREGLKVPKKQRKTRHSGQHENGCDHHRSDHPDDVWAWDFVFDRTSVSVANGAVL